MEEDFPRGGTTSRGTKRKAPKPINEDDLFKTEEPKLVKSRRKQEEFAKKKSQGRNLSVLQRTPTKVDFIRKKELTLGTLILGCVKEVRQFELLVCMPNDLLGVVPITSISDAYTDQLHQIAASTDTEAEEQDVASLDDLFRPGQVVRAQIKETPQDTKLQLSLNPKNVNSNLSVSALKNGMTLTCTVSSREDHGYVLDLGIQGTSCFITNKEAQLYADKCNQGKPFQIGTYLHTTVTSSAGTSAADDDETSRTIKVTLDPQKVNKSQVNNKMAVTLQTLLPGTIVQGRVTKVLNDGIQLTFLSYNGTIHNTHLLKVAQKYREEEVVKAAVICIHPTLKTVTLTQLPHFLSPGHIAERPFGDLEAGDVVEEAKIVHVDRFRGLLVTMGNNIKGQVKKSHFSDKEVKNVTETFKKGEAHRCRILSFNYADHLVMLSLRQSILDSKLRKYSDLLPGMVVECKISKFHSSGVSVKLTNHIRGYIPFVHLSDVPLRHPEKKFSVDDDLTCKVLDVKVKEKRLYLTNKKSLVNSKYPSLTRYEDCVKGQVTEGFIFKVGSFGAVVKFYGEVQGFLSKKMMSSEVVEYPEKLFYVGQVVRVQIVKFDVEKRDVLVSCKIGDVQAEGVKRNIRVPKDFSEGKLVDCKIKDKLERGFDVQLLPSKMSAVLPKQHLSDSRDGCDLLYHSYSKGDVIKNAMYLSKNNLILLTKKQSLIQANKEEDCVKSFDNLHPGLLLPGVIKRKMDYGVFVDLGHGLTGLAPSKHVSDQVLVKPAILFEVGQSVVVKVTEVDKEKQRFLVSLRMSDCYHGDVNEGLDLLTSFCDEYDQAMATMRVPEGEKDPLQDFQIGQIIPVKITSVIEKGALCKHKNGTKGFITEDHMPGVVCEEGQTLEAVVLYIDPVASCLELSVNPELIKTIRNLKDDKFSKVRMSQVIKSEVQLIKDAFVLVSLKGHAQGRLAYLPARKHLNDSLEKHQYVVGQVNVVVVKRIHGNYTLANLKIHEDEKRKEKLDLKHGRNSPVKIGAVLTADVIGVLDLQLNIRLRGYKGRVHVTEITDIPQQGECPLSKFTKGQTIKVKVIGFRDSKSSSVDANISSEERKDLFIECSLRKSRMSSEATSSKKVQYKNGQTVKGFVVSKKSSNVYMNLNPEQKARVHILNIKNDPKVSTSSFEVGQYYKATVIDGKKKVIELSLMDKPWRIETGSVVLGQVKRVHARYGLRVQLPQGHWGQVAPPDLVDEFVDGAVTRYVPGQCVQCCVLSCDKKNKKNLSLSLRPSRLATASSPSAVPDPEVAGVQDLEEGTVVRGIVKQVEGDGLVISLGTSVSGRVPHHKVSVYFIKLLSEAFPVGKVVTAKITSMGKDIELSLLEADTGVPEAVGSEHYSSRRIVAQLDATKQKEWKERSRKRKLGDSPSAGGKSQKVQEEGMDSGVDSDSDSEFKPVVLRTKSGAPRLSLSAAFSWQDKDDIQSAMTAESDGSDGDSEDEVPAKVKVKRSKQDKIAEQKLEEQTLFERERLLMSGDQTLESAEQFDRLLLHSPDSSLVWLRYMAYHLETAEIEKAQAVAERALKTISFREEQEKLNMWVGYMNLEHMYGTEDSLNKVYERAIQYCDATKVTMQLIQIYAKAGKTKAAEDLFSGLVKRQKVNKDIWVSFGSFYFSQSQLDAGRKLMQRALTSLDKKHHVEVIAKFAQLEFKDGEPDRGRTMFENVLSNYPKRTDLWSVYIDMVTKQGDPQVTRMLYDRVISLSLSAKKMRFFFKKYLAFEERHGDEDTVKAVKLKALKYVEEKAIESS